VQYIQKPITTADAAYHLAKKAYGLLNVELKLKDFDCDDASVTETASQHTLTEILPGDTYQGRDGRKVRLKHLEVRGRVRLGASATRGHGFEVALVRSKTRAVVTQATVFKNVEYNSLLNIDYEDTFSILFRKTFDLSAAGKLSHTIDINMPLDHIVKWDKDDTDGTAYESGQLVLMFISDTSTANLLEIECEARVKYLDN
jgi:hypothetical protein